MIKILFVLEKGKNLCYGAETSLKEYLKEFSKDEEIEIDLLVKKSILTSKKEIKKNVKKFMKEVKIKNIFIMSLPVKTDDYEKKEIRDIISELVNEFFWIFNKKRYEKILERNKYDLIHINSSSLYKAIKGNENCILHIRTGIKKETIKSIMEYLKKAKGMIFIDQYTFQPFSDFDYAKKIILNNPIDGYKSLNINLETRKQYMKKFNLKKEDIVISLIGRISEDKGTEYLINEFNDSLRKDIVFLIIGNANTSKRMYEEKCKKIAQKNNRIIFTGVILDIEYIYSISDYVVRGEDEYDLGIGRTHLEALFSGLKIIVPGTKEIIEKNDILKKFSKQIIFYEARKKGAFLKEIEKIEKIGERKIYSNILEYVKKMKQFYKEILSNNGEK